MEAVCDSNRCIERPKDQCGGDAAEVAETSETSETEAAETDILPELDGTDTQPEIETNPEIEAELEPEVIAEPDAETSIEVAPDTEPETVPDADAAPEVDTAPDTQSEVDTAPDTEPETTLDAGPDIEVEPEVVDPCPGGCGHLDQACKVGVCGEAGCEAIDDEGDCDDGQACTSDDRCEAGACVGDAVVCQAIDDCHIAGVCNPASGICSTPNQANGHDCSDGDVCTENETCQAGACRNGTLVDDDSDWFVVTSQFGANEIVLQDDGTLWWFLNLTVTQTTVGKDGSGNPVTLSLPGGAARGVGAVLYDTKGKVARAFLMAHSTDDVQLFGSKQARAQVTKNPFTGATALVVPLMFIEDLTIPGSSGQPRQFVSTSGGFASLAVAFYDDLGGASVVLQLENPGYSNSVDGAGASSIAISPSGAVMVAMTVGSDVLAEVVGKAQFRAPVGPFANLWVIYFATGGAISWQRVLLGRDAQTGASSLMTAIADDGTGYLTGTFRGPVDWRRVDDPQSLGSLAATTGPETFLLRMSSAGDMDLMGTIGGGFANRAARIVPNPLAGVTMHFAVGAELSTTTDSGTEVILDAPASTQFAVVEFGADLDVNRLFVNAEPNLHKVDYRGADEIVFTSVGATGLTLEGIDPFPPVPANVEIEVDGIGEHAWSTPPIVAATSNPNVFSLGIGFSARPGIGLAGIVSAGSVQVAGQPTWLVNDGEGFIARINSEGGVVCSDR